MTETVRAIQITRFGDPAEVIENRQVPIPQPVDDEVLVRVRAASINPVDWKIAQGDYPPVGADKLPLVLGRDLAGTIEAVGTRAHYMLRHGDPVFAFIGQDRGAQSDYVVVRAVELVAMPDGLDFAEAAGAVPRKNLIQAIHTYQNRSFVIDQQNQLITLLRGNEESDERGAVAARPRPASPTDRRQEHV